MQTNLPYTVYRFDRLQFPGDTPKNEQPVSHHLTFQEAARESDNIQRNDKTYSYGVGTT